MRRTEPLQRLEVCVSRASVGCVMIVNLHHWYSMFGCVVAQTPQLCKAPSGDDPWWRPMQLTCYANQIRLVSAVHALLLGLVLLLTWLGAAPVAAVGLLLVFILDVGVFIVHGSSPFGVLGVPTTWIVWRSRGPAVTSIPYKVVWTAYLATLIPMLLDCGEVEPLGSCVPQLNTTAHQTSLALFTGNSAMLGALRF